MDNNLNEKYHNETSSVRNTAEFILFGHAHGTAQNYFNKALGKVVQGLSFSLLYFFSSCYFYHIIIV